MREIDEISVREVHGVRAWSDDAAKGSVIAREFDHTIEIGLRGVELYLNADSALRLAAMLRRLARRVKARTP